MGERYGIWVMRDEGSTVGVGGGGGACEAGDDERTVKYSVWDDGRWHVRLGM